MGQSKSWLCSDCAGTVNTNVDTVNEGNLLADFLDVEYEITEFARSEIQVKSPNYTSTRNSNKTQGSFTGLPGCRSRVVSRNAEGGCHNLVETIRKPAKSISNILNI